MGLRGGDALARGAKSAKFSTGGARPDEKVNINKGMVSSAKDAKEFEQTKAEVTAAEPEKLKSKVRPLFDQVLIRKSAELDRSKGGIFIPEDAKDRPSEGTVLYVGRGHKQDDGSWQPLEVEPGELVIFGKYAGIEVKIDGETLLIMKESAILAVLEAGQ